MPNTSRSVEPSHGRGAGEHGGTLVLVLVFLALMSLLSLGLLFTTDLVYEVSKSFQDRIEQISIPYVMDMKTEVEIYRNIFGKHIEGSFLPRVLYNFARVIISTRLNKTSEALIEWIGSSEKYQLYCDKNLQLLKMEIYSGNIPAWLTE